MTVHKIDPLKDPRWGEFVHWHPRASVFHTAAWLDALHRTYGYEPVAYTTSAPGQDLRNGIVFCKVDSWLTGRRLVSLPFSDHCEPLVDEPADLHDLLEALQRASVAENWRYIEIRPLRSLDPVATFFHETETYAIHLLDVSPDVETLFRNFHKDSTQRKIRRAEREGLTEQEGRSDSLLDIFYRLQLLTRRRHQLPPQPRNWFRDLIDCLGDALKIRVAFKEGRPVAGILTLRCKDTLMYKYGCSDAQFNRLGGMHFLFWRAIQDAKTCGIRILDLGRSEGNNSGLIIFKDRWGAKRSTLTYERYATGSSQPRGGDWKLTIAKRVFKYAPDSFLSAIGSLLYKHIG
jgi:CelD/BcsL family acetyltransferase involved in cellulose biosynthesis